MKRTLFALWVVLLSLYGCGTDGSAKRASGEIEPYFTAEQMPDLLKWLPAPPDTLSQAFAYDLSQYEWGKQQRLDPDRAAAAIHQADLSAEAFCAEFSEPFGMTISREETPEIFSLLMTGVVTCDKIGTLPKAHYMRRRPYDRLGEPSLVPEDEEVLRSNGSYPSGHTIFGWSAALLLSEINPDAADALMKRGYMFGESRVIAGYHWQSDVDAGRLAASVAVAKLHTSERFIAQMERAKAEYSAKKSRSAESRSSVAE